MRTLRVFSFNFNWSGVVANTTNPKPRTLDAAETAGVNAKVRKPP